MARDPLDRILTSYPVVHHACRRRSVAAPGGRRVSAHQAAVLGRLDRRDGSTLTDLAGAVGVALPTMSLLVDRLVRAGLVRRERDPSDGRRVLLRLTAVGDRVRASHSLLDPERVRELLGVMTPEERAAGAEGLAVMARAVRRLSPPAGPAGATRESP
jgi:DNA-binding MarR family transcriptional regulator